MVFQEVSKDINGSFKTVLCFKKVSRVFQESFNCVSKNIEGCFKGVFSAVQGDLKEI